MPSARATPRPAPSRALASAGRGLIAALLLAGGCAARAAPPTDLVKHPIIGLVTMGSEGWFGTGSTPPNRLREARAHPGIYSAVAIDATWQQLEPQPGVFVDQAIDAALQRVRAYNRRYPATPLVVKLRIFAGIQTPPWALRQVGSVRLLDRHTWRMVRMPAFWTLAYSVLWTRLQDHLAAVYDVNPLIAEVAVSSCSSFTAEPTVDGAPVPGNAQRLVAAGYTDAQYTQCLSNAWADYSAWKITPLDEPFGPVYLAQARHGDRGISVPLMAAFHKALGARAVLGNQGLRDPIAPGEQATYAGFRAAYRTARAAQPPQPWALEFQTAGPQLVNKRTIAYGIRTYYPTEIELWNSRASGHGVARVSTAQLRRWAHELREDADDATSTAAPEVEAHG